MQGKVVRSLLGCTVFVAIWALAAGGGTTLLPSPLNVLQALGNLAAEGRLWSDVLASALRVFAGIGLAAIISLSLLGMALVVPSLSDVFSGPIELLRPIPPIAWVPIGIAAFGASDRSAIAIVATGAFFPMWLGGISGIASIRRAHVLAARSLGAGSRHLLTGVVGPCVLPAGLRGLRLGVGMGWFSVVAAEMIGAPGGLGQGLQLYSMNLQTAQLYAYILTIGIIGYILNALILALQRRVCRWQETDGWRHE
jgi:ABC-type nitrate/sulfonate/bicarbonate transport system permease component